MADATEPAPGHAANSKFANSQVGIFGIRRPLARNNNPAVVERPGCPIHHLFQPDGYSHYPVHCHRQARHPPAYHQAIEADAGHERPSTPYEGNTDPLRQRPVRNFQTDDGPIQGSRRQPHRLLGPICHPDAHPIWALPRPDSGIVLPARQPGRPVGKALHLDPSVPHLRGGPAAVEFSLAGPSRAGPNEPHHAGPGVRIDLAPAEDDDDPVGRPETEQQPNDDALDDAVDDRLFLVHIAQWTGTILDFVKPNGHRHTILCYWVAAHFPVVPQAGSRGRCRPSATI